MMKKQNMKSLIYFCLAYAKRANWYVADWVKTTATTIHRLWLNIGFPYQKQHIVCNMADFSTHLPPGRSVRPGRLSCSPCTGTVAHAISGPCTDCLTHAMCNPFTFQTNEITNNKMQGQSHLYFMMRIRTNSITYMQIALMSRVVRAVSKPTGLWPRDILGLMFFGSMPMLHAIHVRALPFQWNWNQNKYVL